VAVSLCDKPVYACVLEGGRMNTTWRSAVIRHTAFTSSTTRLCCTTSSRPTPETTRVTWPTWPPRAQKLSPSSSPVSCWKSYMYIIIRRYSFEVILTREVFRVCCVLRTNCHKFIWSFFHMSTIRYDTIRYTCAQKLTKWPA